ncbi:MAG TPA: hypothetical protein VGW39_02995 [Chthoniobacterales bacterium]|nr:hypothetical protein [Chthoniobacterales bacterium]
MSAPPAVIITTRLPPQICGIGAHSWLAHKHRPDDSAPARFLVLDGAAESGALLGLDAITDFNGDPRRLGQALDRAGLANVLLHYAGRAYQRFGCPIWMPGVLRRWKTKFPEGRLTVFFHEIPGRLPRLSRHFLLGKINSRIIRQLAALADALVTNTEHHATLLRELSGRDDVHCICVGSNIEPVASSPEPRIKTEFIVFGLPFGRLQTLRLFDLEIRRWQARGRLTALHLIGPEDQKFTAQANELIDAWPTPTIAVRHGLLPDAAVSRLFARAQFALTNVTAETWSKSGAFMACAAAGCAAVIKAGDPQSVPLSFAILADEVEKISEAELASRTVSLKAWYYQNADWNVTARRLAALSEPREPAA